MTRLGARLRMLGRPDERAQPFSWRFTAPMFLGSALNPINSSLIATALVPIARGVRVSVGQTVVLVSVLYLASAIAQPTFGKLAEEFGARRVFLTGITLVLAGGLVGGFAHSLTILVIARVLIGIGTSGGYPSAMLMIRRRAESVGMGTPPGGVLGGLQIAGTAAVALGLPLGGVLVNAFGWRSVFFANVPVTVVALVLGAAWLPRDPALADSLKVREIARRIDLTGIVAFGGAIAALLVFLDGLPHPDWLALAVGRRARDRPRFLGAACHAGVRRRTPARHQPGAQPHLPTVRAHVVMCLHGALRRLAVAGGGPRLFRSGRRPTDPADGRTFRGADTADLAAEPRPRPADRRSPVIHRRSDRGAAPRDEHARHRNRRRHARLRRDARNVRAGQPNRALHPNRGPHDRHCGGPAAHLRLHRFNRVRRDPERRVPQRTSRTTDSTRSPRS